MLLDPVYCIALIPGDVVEFRVTFVWTKFDLAELAEGEVEKKDHPCILGRCTLQSCLSSWEQLLKALRGEFAHL